MSKLEYTKEELEAQEIEKKKLVKELVSKYACESADSIKLIIEQAKRILDDTMGYNFSNKDDGMIRRNSNLIVEVAKMIKDDMRGK